MALQVTGSAINIPSFMGAIMTVGLVVAYSVLLVDFANRLREEEGMDAFDAISEAARLRLRPIMMTSMTTSVAMIPLATGDTANAPLAAVIIGGVVAAGFLTLFVVPSFYLIVAGRRGARPIAEEIA